MAATRVDFVLNLMLGDSEPFDWQVDHLSAFHNRAGLLSQVLLALLTTLDGMDQDFIRGRNLLEVLTAMARLPASVLATLFPQALGRSHEAIRGRRQVTIVAIFGFLLFQFLDTSLQKVAGLKRLLQACA